MRIALIRQRYNPFGGAERFVERAVKALAAQGAEVTVIAREWQGAEGAAAGALVKRDPFHVGRVWRDWSFARAACSASSEGFDLVQSHERLACCDVYRAGDGVHAQWLANRARLQPAWRAGLARLAPYHAYLLAAERRMFESPRLRAVICNSRMVREEILSRFRIGPEKLHVVYNGVDLERFSPRLRESHRDATRARLGSATHEHLHLFVGSGFERKGVPRLLDAFARVADPRARLCIVGADRSLDAARAQAARLGIAARVAFEGGQTDVRPYYAAADSFVLPTLYDPFPNAALEALACGLPVVTSAQCGAAEVVTEGANGFVVDALDLEGLAAAMGAVRSLDAVAATTAARDAVAGLGIDAMASRLLDLYRGLLERDGG